MTRSDCDLIDLVRFTSFLARHGFEDVPNIIFELYEIGRAANAAAEDECWSTHSTYLSRMNRIIRGFNGNLIATGHSVRIVKTRGTPESVGVTSR